jgi:tRNA threonylcarbamoyl adenosine modification protein YeaZ
MELGMVCLAIDTSSALTSVAIDCGDGRVLQKELYAEDSHSQSLRALVNQLIIESGLSKLSDVSELMVGLGPGSFTGLRISLSYLKGVSWSLQIPLVGMSSFLAVAKAQTASSIAVISDARRDEYFFASYKQIEADIVEAKGLSILSRENLIAEIHESKPERVINLSRMAEADLPFTKDAANNIALGLLKNKPKFDAWNLTALNAIQPIYLREVAALTVEQRRARGWN